MNYFAYGADMPRQQMAERCPRCKPRTVASLPNHRLMFTGWSRRWRGGVASVRQAQGERVAGAVYEVSDAELRLMDKEEGYPALRDRVIRVVFTPGGEALEVSMYISKGQGEETKPTPEYVALLHKGYKEWGVI